MIDSDKPTPLHPWLGRSFPVRALSRIYSCFVNRRNRLFDTDTSRSYHAERKVISIGGIRAGGTGKTPLTLLTAEYLRDEGIPVALLSRGYGRRSRKDLLIKPGEEARWQEAGDEPSMFHSHLPQSWVAVSARRSDSARVLSGITPENTVFLLDDGFQHRKLHRDLDLVCVDKAVLNDRLIPCGYLREPLESLNRADAVFLIDYSGSVQECYKIKAELSKRFPDLPCFILCQEADCWVNFNTGQRIRTPPLPNPVAFCGIARPNRFFDLLRSLEVRPCKELKFSDHHIYNEPDFKSIHELYSQGMVTTEKDAFRLKNSGVVIPSEFWYLKIKLRFTDSDSQSVFNRLITGLISNT